jgi:hypothetical protein
MRQKAKRIKLKESGGERRGAGRPKGSLNKSTVEFRDYAKSFTNESIDRLVMIMRNHKDVWAVLAAIEQLQSRAFGRAPQAVTIDSTHQHTVVYKSLVEVKASLRERGIDMDRLVLPPDDDDKPAASTN